jgi:hypothetical protein
MKRLIWTALASLLSAGAAALAIRLLDRVWRRVTDEEPPDTQAWGRLLVGLPLKKLAGLLEPDTAP